jgi:hypothetical protein
MNPQSLFSRRSTPDNKKPHRLAVAMGFKRIQLTNSNLDRRAAKEQRVERQSKVQIHNHAP